MTINHYTGVMSDTIYYNVIFFNQDTIRTQSKLYAEKEDDIFLFYDEIRKGKNVIDPPESLYPFFFYDIKIPCVVTEYFHKKFDFFMNKHTDFSSIFKDVDYFKRFVFFFYLEQHKEININAALKGDTIEIGKALVAMRQHGERANTFVYLFNNFDQLVEELIRYLNKLHHKMKLFHGKKKGHYQETIDRFCSNDNINILKKTYGIKDKVNILKQTFSVSFMQQYRYLLSSKNNDSNYSFVVGYRSHVVVPKYLNYNFLTPITAAIIYTNPLMNSIIRALKKEELTITKLAIKLAMSRATADRLIGILYDDLAIQITRTIGNEKYYRLNPEYFLAIKSVLVQDIDDILLGM